MQNTPYGTLMQLALFIIMKECNTIYKKNIFVLELVLSNTNAISSRGNQCVQYSNF